jgi:hypothetical protein
MSAKTPNGACLVIAHDTSEPRGNHRCIPAQSRISFIELSPRPVENMEVLVRCRQLDLRDTFLWHPLLRSQPTFGSRRLFNRARRLRRGPRCARSGGDRSPALLTCRKELLPEPEPASRADRQSDCQPTRSSALRVPRRREGDWLKLQPLSAGWATLFGSRHRLTLASSSLNTKLSDPLRQPTISWRSAR